MAGKQPARMTSAQEALELLAASQAQRERDELEAEAGRQRTVAQANALAEAEHQRAEVKARSNRRLRWLSASLVHRRCAGCVDRPAGRSAAQRGAAPIDLAQTAQAIADAERGIAEKEASLARARQLAAQVTQPGRSCARSVDSVGATGAASQRKPGREVSVSCSTSTSSVCWAPCCMARTPASISAAISPNGRLLAAGGEDGSIWLWDLERNQPLGSPLTGHQQPVQSLAWSPDGTRLASAIGPVSCGSGMCQSQQALAIRSWRIAQP